jgi:hypothetical protein
LKRFALASIADRRSGKWRDKADRSVGERSFVHLISAGGKALIRLKPVRGVEFLIFANLDNG